MLIPNNAHAMSKRSSGLDKYFVVKRKLVEDREGSNTDSTENYTSSNELATDEASSSFDLEISAISLLKTNLKSWVVSFPSMTE